MLEALSTTTLARVRGFTLDLLFILQEGPRRCCDLAEITEKSHYYVDSYLRRMRFYGLVEKNGVLWNLSVLGRDFISYLKEVGKYSIVCRQKVNRKQTEGKQKVNTSNPKKPKQVAILPFLRNLDLEGAERDLVEVLVKHYDKTGSKFILVRSQFELADRLNKNPQDIMEAFKNLRQDNIIYIVKSKEFEGIWKIGLKKAFIEGLKKEAEA